MEKEGKKKKVGLTINVFVKGEDIDEVTTGTHLGQGELAYDEEDEIYEGTSHFRPNSKVPVTFGIIDLGTPSVVEVQDEGTHEVDVKFNALDFLDEKEKREALTDDERADLQEIGILELRAIAAEHHIPNTPFEDAVIAILQHEEGATYGDVVHLPKPGIAYNTKPGVGPVKGASVTLEVGNYEFDELHDGFIAEIKPCADGRILYQYNWTGVAAYVLDEPQ
jgi:hypothetical protein